MAYRTKTQLLADIDAKLKNGTTSFKIPASNHREVDTDIVDSFTHLEQMQTIMEGQEYGASYFWADEDERGDQTGMSNEERGLQVDTGVLYEFQTPSPDDWVSLGEVSNLTIDESLLVHKAGLENITGTKTFTANPPKLNSTSHSQINGDYDIVDKKFVEDSLDSIEITVGDAGVSGESGDYKEINIAYDAFKATSQSVKIKLVGGTTETAIISGTPALSIFSDKTDTKFVVTLGAFTIDCPVKYLEDFDISWTPTGTDTLFSDSNNIIANGIDITDSGVITTNTIATSGVWNNCMIDQPSGVTDLSNFTGELYNVQIKENGSLLYTLNRTKSRQVVQKATSTIASANTLTLPNSGISFKFADTTNDIQLINSEGWKEGAEINLTIPINGVLKNEYTLSGVNYPLRLASGADFVAPTETVLKFLYEDSLWKEIGSTSIVISQEQDLFANPAGAYCELVDEDTAIMGIDPTVVKDVSAAEGSVEPYLDFNTIKFQTSGKAYGIKLYNFARDLVAEIPLCEAPHETTFNTPLLDQKARWDIINGAVYWVEGSLGFSYQSKYFASLNNGATKIVNSNDTMQVAYKNDKSKNYNL